MKICFINTALNEDSPPMNLVYLATVLKASGLHEVKIVDETFKMKNIYKEIQNYDCVGISAMTRYYKKACMIAQGIKRDRSLPIIVGGCHITTAPESLSADFALGVIGEGEDAIVRLCKTYDEEGQFAFHRLKEISGLVYWEDSTLKITQTGRLIENLDKLPIPDYSLLDKNYFRKKWIFWNNRLGKSMKIITSRGCPFNCIFCASRRIWQKVRLHSPVRIFQEVSELAERWGIDHIYVDDDLFIVDEERLAQLASLMEQSGLSGRISFFCSARSSLVDDNICGILKRIGVKALNFGFESGSNRMLQYLKGGNISVETHTRAIESCRKHGLKVWGSFMIGSPTETLEDMDKTIQFIDSISSHCQRLGLFVATPLPGTALWDIAKCQGTVSDNMDWDMLDYSNYKKPMLLDPSIDESEFKKRFIIASAFVDKMLLKHTSFQALLSRYRKVAWKAIENPKRAVSVLTRILRRI